MNQFTTDTFFNGCLRVKQHRPGYRFSIDAVLLAHYADPQSGDRVLDLGTGCGIISLILAYRRPDIRIYGVEVQKELAELALSNLKENRQQNRISVICTDMKLLKSKMTGGLFDLVVCNPPYRKYGSGRISPDKQRAIARHEIKANLPVVVQTARRMLRTSGRFVLIYSAERMTDVLSQMRADHVEPKYIRMIHSDPDSEARLVLIEGVKAARPGLKIASPLIVYDRNGEYTDEVQSMFRP